MKNLEDHIYLLTEDHVAQRLGFANEILEKKIKSSAVMFTDECRVVLFPKVNSQINANRLSEEEDRENIYLFK